MKNDNRRLGLTDKPYQKVTPAFEDEIVQVDAAARRVGEIDRLYLVTEYARDPIKLYNAELIRAVRDAAPDVDALAVEVMEACVGEASLQQLVGEINRGPRDLQALVRLIRSGQLRMVREEKITYESLVRPAGAEN